MIEAVNSRDIPRLTGGADIPFSELEEASESIRERINDKDNKVKAISLKERGITDYGSLSRRGHLITAGATAQMIVSVDGNDMRLAAYPNDSWLTITDSNVTNRADARFLQANGGSFKLSDSRISQWQSRKRYG